MCIFYDRDTNHSTAKDFILPVVVSVVFVGLVLIGLLFGCSTIRNSSNCTITKYSNVQLDSIVTNIKNR